MWEFVKETYQLLFHPGDYEACFALVLWVMIIFVVVFLLITLILWWAGKLIWLVPILGVILIWLKVK